MDDVWQKLIVALDYSHWEPAEKLVRELPQVDYFKVGLELYLGSNGRAVRELKKMGKKVFLDLKFHDIPQTVAQACQRGALQKVDILNVHALGGSAMLRRGVEAIRNCSPRPLLFAVTILTSLGEEEIQRIGLDDVASSVSRLALLAKEAGLDGVVASPREISLIKNCCGTDFRIICPGIRPAWAQAGDQKRVLTPGEALKRGADYLVVGRPITGFDNPGRRAGMIIKEMKEALQ